MSMWRHLVAKIRTKTSNFLKVVCPTALTNIRPLNVFPILIFNFLKLWKHYPYPDVVCSGNQNSGFHIWLWKYFQICSGKKFYYRDKSTLVLKWPPSFAGDGSQRALKNLVGRPNRSQLAISNWGCVNFYLRVKHTQVNGPYLGSSSSI